MSIGMLVIEKESTSIYGRKPQEIVKTIVTRATERGDDPQASLQRELDSLGANFDNKSEGVEESLVRIIHFLLGSVVRQRYVITTQLISVAVENERVRIQDLQTSGVHAIPVLNLFFPPPQFPEERDRTLQYIEEQLCAACEDINEILADFFQSYE